MDTIWIVVICYAVIGFIVGVVMMAKDMQYVNEPGEELVWIPLGIIAWPIFVGLALRDWLNSSA